MPAVEPGDEVGLPWEKWADGRAHRLTKGKHFLRSVTEIREAAANAAERLGRPVQAIPDTWNNKSYVWVQFADAEIVEGDPCVCGGTNLRRATPVHAVCGSCGSTLIVVKPKQDRTPETALMDDELRRLLEPLLIFPEAKSKRARPVVAAAPEEGADAGTEPSPPPPTKTDEAPEARLAPLSKARIWRLASQLTAEELPSGGGNTESSSAPKGKPVPPTQLSDFTHVKLTLHERTPAGEKYSGTGVDSRGTPCLIFVHYPLSDERRIEDPDSPLGVRHSVVAVPADSFGSAIDQLVRSGEPAESNVELLCLEKWASRFIGVLERERGPDETRAILRKATEVARARGADLVGWWDLADAAGIQRTEAKEIVGRVRKTPEDPPSGDSDEDEKVELVSAAVTAPDGTRREQLGGDEPAVLEVVVDSAVHLVQLTCWVDLVGKGRSSAQLRQPGPFVVESAGGQRITAWLPAGLLEDGRYRGHVAVFVDRHGASRKISSRDAFSLVVGDPETTQGSETEEARERIQSDDLEWRLERLPDSSD